MQAQLPADLRARIGERVFVESLGESRGILPDDYVAERPATALSTSSIGGVAMAEPIIVTLSEDPISQGYIEIREAGTGHRVEFISPTNKLSGSGRDQYVQKQEECLRAGINLVEIDLVRRGNWVLSVPRGSFVAGDEAAYCICVRRGPYPNRGEIFPVSLRTRLPIIPVPLRESEADVPLDLQRLVDRCYEQGHYADDVDYLAEPDPPLSPADAAWTDELLRAAGRR